MRPRLDTLALIAASVAMTRLDRRLAKTGGGIVALELASHGQAVDLLAGWGAGGRRTARVLVWADFGYMALYGAVASRLTARGASRAGWTWGARIGPMLPWLAVGCDAAEGVGLLHTLYVDAPSPRVVAATRGFARAKFGLLIATGVVSAVAWSRGSATAD